MSKKKKKRIKTWKLALLIALIAALLVTAGIVVWYKFIRKPVREEKFERYQFDTDAMLGRIQQMTEEEIDAELKRVIEEGMFNISIASAVVFDPQTGEGEARIENVAANHYHMQVDITLDDTGEEVYSSKLIKPGYSIENIKLNRKLKPGVYNATAIFSAITQEELQLVGTAGAQIRLFILDKDGNVPGLEMPEPTYSPAPEVSVAP